MPDHGITCSVSRSGNVWGNAAMESFFSSRKTERTARKVYRTRDDARADMFDYIELFYNPRRRHSTPGYLSPVELEEKAMSLNIVSENPAVGHFPVKVFENAAHDTLKHRENYWNCDLFPGELCSFCVRPDANYASIRLCAGSYDPASGSSHR
jgi:hypothetical protein